MLFGITIATYRRRDNSTPAKLARCLQSINRQSYSNWRAFLIGDHYEPEAEFIELSRQLPNEKCVAMNLPLAAERETLKLTGPALWCCGGTNAMNQALELQRLAEIRYTTHLDDDDYWKPNHLEVLMKAYQENPELAFVYTQAFHLGKVMPSVAADFGRFPNNLPPRAGGLVHSSASWDINRIPLSYINCIAELKQNFPTDAYMWTKIAAHCAANGLPTMFIPVITMVHSESGFCHQTASPSAA